MLSDFLRNRPFVMSISTVRYLSLPFSSLSLLRTNHPLVIRLPGFSLPSNLDNTIWTKMVLVLHLSSRHTLRPFIYVLGKRNMRW